MREPMAHSDFLMTALIVGGRIQTSNHYWLGWLRWL